MIRTLQARPPTLEGPGLIPLVARQTQPGAPVLPSQESTSKRRVPVIREVLIALDGSGSAEHALPWAMRIAESARAQLRIVHVHEQMDQSFNSRGSNRYRDFDQLLREPNERYLADVVKRLTRAGAHSLKPLLLEGRDVAETLAELTTSADLTVMATRRRSRLGRFLFGSVSQTVLRNASKPLLLVRGYNYPVDFTSRPLLSHALAPWDGSPGSEEILPSLAALSRLADGKQTLLRVLS